MEEFQIHLDYNILLLIQEELLSWRFHQVGTIAIQLSHCRGGLEEDRPHKED